MHKLPKTKTFYKSLSTSTSCRKCKSKNNTSLHAERQRNKVSEKDKESKEDACSSEANLNAVVVGLSTASYVVQKSNHDVLFATATAGIDFINGQGIHFEARAALDAGSQLNFIKRD